MRGIARGSIQSRGYRTISTIRQHVALWGASVLLTIGGAISSSLFAQTPITNGYRDFNYGSTVFEAPTADKPQSKLWWNDGFWWGCLWQPSANKYRIHRFDLATQSWIDVGPDIDDRSQSLADALWDGQKLYIASHVYSGGSQTSGNASAANSARLYRYSYDATTATYGLDAGFPVLVNSAICEALVIDKDSLGRLWATWTQSSKVYLNRSLNNDLTWGTPFALPTQGANLSSDDISTLMAYDGKIGVVWSNQSAKSIYFSFHHDSNADTDWEPQEVALSDPSLGAVADDHLNIKMINDGGGDLYVTTKTSLSGSSNPGVYLLKRSFSGGWTQYVVATKADDYTRPIVVIDDENRELYVFGKSGSNIYRKKVSLDDINFPPGAGEPFIRGSNADINDATVSKHNVNGTTGLLILASDEVNRYYYHNYIALANSAPPPTIASFAPTDGPAGTAVTITGNNLSGTTSVAFNGTAASFAVNSNTQITATVPAGATTGKISIVKTTGTATSDNDFTVTSPTQYALIVNVAGSGSVNPSGGLYSPGAVVTLTATPEAGFQFSGWSGDLSGTANPAMITMDADKNITATFTASGGGGQVVYHGTKTGGSSSSKTVETSTNLLGASGHLYLAAISTRPSVAVTKVSGLDLAWSRVLAQCSGNNSTGVEIWIGRGTPNGNGAVTATLASKSWFAAIAVSRYSGVDAANPIGNIISGNTNGLNGACSGGTDNKSYSFTLTTATNGAVIHGAIVMRDRTHTPGAGYQERAEFRMSGASIAVVNKSAAMAEETFNGKFNKIVDWAAAALEIKPQSSGGGTQYTLTANAVGSGSVNPSTGTYDAGAVVTLTATPNAGYQLEQNYPNPFWSAATSRSAGNPNTMINLALPEAGTVRLKIYNETGQLVRTLVDHELSAGRHQARWDGRNELGQSVAAGMYLYRIVVTGQNGTMVFAETKRMLFLK